MSAAVRWKHRGLLAAVQREKAQHQPCACGCNAEAWRQLEAAAAATEIGADQRAERMGQLKTWERLHITYAREIAVACWVGFALVVWWFKP